MLIPEVLLSQWKPRVSNLWIHLVLNRVPVSPRRVSSLAQTCTLRASRAWDQEWAWTRGL